jgi:hypothetical protein
VTLNMHASPSMAKISLILKHEHALAVPGFSSDIHAHMLPPSYFSNTKTRRPLLKSAFCVESYRKMYSGIIHPVLDKEYWSLCEDEEILPPKTRCPPGRPQKKIVRREDEGFGKRSVHCSTCRGVGHYRNTCLEPI